jgi:hypothetical protein
MQDNDTRVTLQYSITLDELPSEIQKLSEKISGKYLAVLKNLIQRGQMFSNSEMLSREHLNTIVQIRDSLRDMDHVASDLENIVGGYIEMAENKDTAPEAKPETPRVPVHVTDELGGDPVELVEKMRLFRETKALNDGQEPASDSSK